MTVGELARRMSYREFVEWMLFYRVLAEPPRKSPEEILEAFDAYQEWRSGAVSLRN